MAQLYKDYEVRGSDRWGWTVWAYAYSAGMEWAGSCVKVAGPFKTEGEALASKQERE